MSLGVVGGGSVRGEKVLGARRIAFGSQRRTLLMVLA